MKALGIGIAAMVALMTPAAASDGVVTVASTLNVKATVDAIQVEAEASGFTVFGRIDHGAAAKAAGLDLRPTELIIFGSPKGGTPLMQLRQTIGLDLPLKMLAWQDGEGKVWISYNDPEAMATRHGLGPTVTGPLKAMGDRLHSLATAAGKAN